MLHAISHAISDGSQLNCNGVAIQTVWAPLRIVLTGS